MYLNNSQFYTQFTTLSLFINENDYDDHHWISLVLPSFSFFHSSLNSFSKRVLLLESFWSPVSYDHHRIEALALFLLFFFFFFDRFWIVLQIVHSIFHFLLPFVTRTSIASFFPFHLRLSSSVFFQLLWSLNLFTETITVKSFSPPFHPLPFFFESSIVPSLESVRFVSSLVPLINEGWKISLGIDRATIVSLHLRQLHTAY